MRSRTTLLVLLFLNVLLGALPDGHCGQINENSEMSQLLKPQGVAPLHFIPNQGQLDEKIKYYAKNGSQEIYITDEGVFLAITRGKQVLETPEDPSKPFTPPERPVVETHVVKLAPLGMLPDAQIVPEDLREAKVNWLLGNDPKLWRSNLPTYGALTYHGAQEGLDLRFYGKDRHLEYDVIVKPGQDPSQVRMGCTGVDYAELTEEGDLLITLKGGVTLRQKKPVIFQVINGQRVEIDGAFKIHESRPQSLKGAARSGEFGSDSLVFGFDVDAYDRNAPVIIDPVIVYANYFELQGSGEDYAVAIDADSSGNAHVAGYSWTTALNFSLLENNPIIGATGGKYNVFVKKLDVAGGDRYTTYLGGNNDSYAAAIACDASGIVYVTGNTLATNFPLKSALYSTNRGNGDAFLAKLNQDGSLLFSTYLGGSQADFGAGIAVNGSGAAFVTGYTSSTNFPTTVGAFRTTRGTGQVDAFVSKINTSPPSFGYSTFLGGNSNNYGRAVAIDASGCAYVTGNTYSSNFPVAGTPLQSTLKGAQDAFVLKLNAAGSGLIYSTFLGGSLAEAGLGIAVDSGGNAYVTGQTNSYNFPILGAYRPALSGQIDGFVSKINPTGSALLYSTYLGGSQVDIANGIDVNAVGEAIVVGETDSSDFPTRNAFHGIKDEHTASFITKLNVQGNDIVFSSFYLGTLGQDKAKGVAVDDSTGAYFAGYSNLQGYKSAFAVKLMDSNAPAITVVTPNGGEVIQAGTIKTIRWSYNGDPGTAVKIELLRETDVVAVLADDEPIGSSGNGYYTWTVPSDQASGSDYRIRIQSTSSTLYTDTSDVPFTISEAVPSAEFEADPTTVSAGEQVQFTDRSAGLVTSWAWEFGDGGRSSEQHPKHRYTTDGKYDVFLRVTGPGGTNPINKVAYITVQPKITVQTPNGGENILAGSNLVVRWTHEGASASEVNIDLLKDGVLHLNIATDLSIASHAYTWAVPASTTPGDDYRIRISSTTYSSNDTSDTNFSIKPIVAEFSATPTNGPSELTVNFKDESKGTVETWNWSFGDGTESTERNPSHIFTAPGTYTVSLTVTGPAGSDTVTKTSYIQVTPPVADFVASTTSGPMELLVNFSDKSKGTVSSWLWDFGDGTPPSTEQNPTHVYSEPGVYSVTLTINVDGDTLTKSDYIKVTTPVAAFSATPTTGDGPLTVIFTDETQGSVTGRLWDFGDNTTSDEQHPVHEYATAGIYTVSLTITYPGGGTHTTTKTNYIRVSPPVAEFSATPTSGTAPLTVSFTDLSTGAKDEWLWDFGDGTTSTEQNPQHEYTQLGVFTVTLEVSGPGGTSTKTKTNLILVPGIRVTTPDGGEDYSAGQTITVNWEFFGNVGSRVRIDLLKAGAVAATISTGAPIGSGGVGSYSYAIPVSRTPGSDYRVRVTSTTSTLYGDTSNNFFTINPPAPVVSFRGTPLSGTAPLTVSFSNTTTGTVNAWLWDFGDQTGETAKAPAHTYTQAGTYTVSLTATGPGGSRTSTRTAYVTVSPPPTITVTDPTAQTSWAGGSTKKVYWQYSGNPGTYVKIELLKGGATHTTISSRTAKTNGASGFTWAVPAGITPGSDYQVRVTSTTNAAYTHTTDPFVITEPAPLAEFTGTPASGRLPLQTTFTNSSTGNYTSCLWDFGDNTPTSTDINPVHTYSTAGVYTVSLTVVGPGGTSTKTRANYISVSEQAPVADFSGTPLTGVAPLSVDFADASTGSITTWSWNFGDGQGSTQQHPTHAYANPGTYTVSLTVVGSGGTDKKTKTAYITATPPPVVADFTASPVEGIAPLTVNFTNSSTGIGNTWLWNFGDGTTSTQQHPVRTYTTPGTYTVTLTATGPGGTSTKIETDLIKVNHPPPVANFTASTTVGPPPLNVTFTDTSTGTVTNRLWEFGDGSESTVQNPTKQYAVQGTYTVKLTVWGPGGTHEQVKTDYIRAYASPLAEFVADQTVGNTPLTVQFTSQSTGPITSYLWDFGDGTTSTDATPPPKVYTNGGSTTITRTVTLTVSGPGGTNTRTRTAYITVKPPAPVADFTASPTSGVLVSGVRSVTFTNLTTGGPVTSWDWDFGDGSAHSTAQNPTKNYTAAGTYTVTLKATGPGGVDTMVKTAYINVYVSPTANFTQNNTAGNITTAATVPVAFKDTSTGNVASWLWEFGNGDTSTSQNPTYAYTALGTYTVRLTVTGPTGVTSTRTRSVTIVTPFTVTAPNGGETWTRGTTRTISWTYVGTPGDNVIIMLYSGTTWLSNIATVSVGSGGNGSHQWTLPANLTTGTRRIRVYSESNNAYWDASNNSFTIN